jgi:hypothetical protein
MAVAVLLGTFFTAWLLLQSPNFFRGYDLVRMHAYYKAYFREAVLSGRLPLWNPFAGLGRPFLSDIETETLYPPNLLVVPLGVAGGLVVSLVLHQAIAIYGGAKLGTELGARPLASVLLGAGFALASPFTARLATGMMPVYFSLCWWPMLLWLASSLQDHWSRAKAACFAVVVALAILAGNPPILFVELLGVACFVGGRMTLASTPLGRRQDLINLAWLCGAGILGVGLSAVQLVPFAELLGQGNRPLHDASFATANGMPPASWLSLIFPASTGLAPNWEFDLYCGLLPAFAAAGALIFWRDRNVRGLLALGLIGGLLSAGNRTPLLGWVIHVGPGASALRFPSRYGICVGAAVLGLAAISVSRRSARSAGLLLAAAAAGAAWIAWLRPYVARASLAPVPYFLSHIPAMAVCALLLAAWSLGWGGRRGATALAAAMALFVLADWFQAVRLLSPVYSQYGFETREKAVGAALRGAGMIKSGEAPLRFSAISSLLPENAGMTGGYSSYASYSNPALRRVWYFLHEAAGITPSLSDFIQLPRAIGDHPERLEGLALAGYIDPVTGETVLHPPVGARAHLAFRTETVPDWRAAVALEAAAHGDPDLAIVEEGTAPSLASAEFSATRDCVITSFTPERVELHADSGIPAILVLAEAWYPGWHATVGGAPTPVFPVNGWMRGVVVPAGASDVVLTYRTSGLGIGAAISLASAVLVILIAVKPSRGPMANGIALAPE